MSENIRIMKTFIFGNSKNEIYPTGEVGDIKPQCYAVLTGKNIHNFVMLKFMLLNQFFFQHNEYLNDYITLVSKKAIFSVA